MKAPTRHYIVWHAEIREREFFDGERDLINYLLGLENAGGVSVLEAIPDESLLRDVTLDAAEWTYERCDFSAVEDPEDPSYGMGDFVYRHIGADRIRREYAAYLRDLADEGRRVA